MKQTLLMVLTVLTPQLVHAQARRADSVGVPVLVVAEALIAADCATTQAGLWAGLRETNPLLGPHPSPARLWASCAAVGAGLALLPRKPRRVVALVVVIAQVVNVAWNIGRLR